MNKRLKKKMCKDCTSCKLFKDWENDSGQYDEYGRCELPPYFSPICSKWEDVEDNYQLLFGGDFREQIKELTGKNVCKYWKRK